jgi:transposase
VDCDFRQLLNHVCDHAELVAGHHEREHPGDYDETLAALREAVEEGRQAALPDGLPPPSLSFRSPAEIRSSTGPPPLSRTPERRVRRDRPGGSDGCQDNREEGAPIRPSSEPRRSTSTAARASRSRRSQRSSASAAETLRKWHKRRLIEDGEEEGLNQSEREELRELRRKVLRLEQERDLLKRAAAFFAKETETR